MLIIFLLPWQIEKNYTLSMCSKNIEKQKHNVILKSNQNCSIKILLKMFIIFITT